MKSLIVVHSYHHARARLKVAQAIAKVLEARAPSASDTHEGLIHIHLISKSGLN